ncbi:hypothetical protein P3T76_005270 [Phytophthora citrophthora]|uniref:RxLR effector protein n=1 Tax=Phytophthora citrophthora TaxID=4793 RepID=A0AAD9GRV3_9STRA|nr:hypothetical protein P3T76_005270 [Phytophthora citrophthora]
MSFSHFVFIAAVTLLFSCNAVEITSGGNQVKLLDNTATNDQAPVRDLGSDNYKSFLRSYKEEDEEDEDKEERGVMTAAQVAKWSDKISDWLERGHTPARIKERLTSLNGVMTAKNKEKYRMFLAAWGKANPQALGRS